MSSNGVPLVNTTVTFNINGFFYNRTTDSTGWAHLNINLPQGNYIISAYNLVTGEVHSNNIIVLPILLAENLTKAYGDEDKFEVTVLDGEGNPYPNQLVQFNINGVFYNRISDVYGVARLNINLPVGIYIVTSSFNGAVISNRISVYEEFSGGYRSFIINANDESFVYNSSFFNVFLGDDSSNPVSGKSVLLSVGDYTCAHLSDNEGYVKWFIDWDVGIYNVTVSLKYNHNVISQHYLITINKSNVLLCNNSPLFGYTNFSYSVKARDYYNHSLSGLNISFNIDNDAFYNVTDEEGVAFCLFNLDIGEYLLNVSFEGNDNFNPSNSLQNITIKDIFIYKEGGFYNQSNLTVNIVSNNHDFYYSFDNSSWNNAYDNISIIFINGEWDLFYCTNFAMIYHNHYIIDNMKPIVFSNYGSGVYNETLQVNLTAIDNVDNNPMIYFSLNESNFILYEGLLDISETSSLKFYAIDSNGHQSEIITCNYIFEKVGNLNSCKGFETIQSAIDDADTNNGDLIMVNEGLYNEHLTINKFVNLISINATLHGLNSSRPVIGITINGSNTTIQGFSIIDSEYGIVVFHAKNVSIINNHFINVVSSIETVYDKDTLIACNSIDSNIILNAMSGIVIRKSDNIAILNNNISLNSNNNACGIISLNTTSNNISITGNNINNKNKQKGWIVHYFRYKYY